MGNDFITSGKSTKPVNISVFVGSSDFDLFRSVIEQGIDSHLQAFVSSYFHIQSSRLEMNFSIEELPILVRRLDELGDSGNESAMDWSNDIRSLEEYPNQGV